MIERAAAVHPREQLLRATITAGAALAPPAVGLNLAPWHALVIVGIVCASLAGAAWGFALLFYAVWWLGALSDETRPDLLLGESRTILVHAAPYWPWSRRIARLRRARRIAALEAANGVPREQRWENL